MKYYLITLLFWGSAWGNFVHAQDAKFVIQPTEMGEVFVLSKFSGQLSFNDETLTVGDIWNFEQRYSLSKFDTSDTASWATNWSGSSYFGNEIGLEMGPSGDLYMFGKFIQEMTFDSNHTLDVGFGNEAYFLTKTGQDGMVKWAINTSGDLHEIYDMAIDDAENIYLTGVFYGSVFFNATGINISPESNGESFLVKINPDGNVLWISVIRQVSGFRMGILAKRLSIHPDGDIAMVGEFGSQSNNTGAIMLDSMTLSLTDKDNLEPFLAVLDSSGKGKLLRRIKGDSFEGVDQISDIDHDAEGNLYLSGYFKNYLKIDTLPPIQNSNHTMLFTAKMNPDYSHGIWAKTGTSNGYSFTYVNDSHIGGNNSLYTVGGLVGTFMIDSTTLESPSNGDSFFIKWNQDGEVDCAVAMSAFGAEQVEIGSPNEIYVMNKEFIEQQINVYDTNCALTRTLRFFNHLPPWSVKDDIEKPNLNVYPQPADEEIIVELELSQYQRIDIVVLDLSGKRLIQKSVQAPASKSTHSLPVFQLPPGVYLLQIQAAEENYIKKLFIER